MKPYIYIVVRQDISPEDQLCQAVHAARAACMHAGGCADEHLVVIGVEDGVILEQALHHAATLGAVPFYDSTPFEDGERKLTAFCTEPITHSMGRRLFPHSEPLSFNRH